MTTTTIKLYDPTDPRYLLVTGPLPERITPEDVFSHVYGRPLTVAIQPAVVYMQPDGPGTDWVRPD
jgi:hypothetical protein